ncbi:uncharacterized protein LOC131199467 [Ahaetulla prasina]|uniref:uncharacterized protein LOC131199467 n=1 Tax=Ahaetulla prasina TaxID=499056 RepID=UPI0026490CAA|nr:uncharacterized protein LOC131199467 [Ahaetulla prasina]
MRAEEPHLRRAGLRATPGEATPTPTRLPTAPIRGPRAPLARPTRRGSGRRPGGARGGRAERATADADSSAQPPSWPASRRASNPLLPEGRAILALRESSGVQRPGAGLALGRRRRRPAHGARRCWPLACPERRAAPPHAASQAGADGKPAGGGRRAGSRRAGEAAQPGHLRKAAQEPSGRRTARPAPGQDCPIAGRPKGTRQGGRRPELGAGRGGQRLVPTLSHLRGGGAAFPAQLRLRPDLGPCGAPDRWPPKETRPLRPEGLQRGARRPDRGRTSAPRNPDHQPIGSSKEGQTARLGMESPPSNRSTFSPIASSSFLLLGIPGLETLHAWLALPFGSLYLVALLGNCTILLLIKTDPRLHHPMYLFLCMLSVNDLVLSTSALPKMPAIFWFDARSIGFSSCLVQMFVIHSFTAMESGFFLAMAYDRYVAICKPLRRSAILSGPRIASIGSAVLARRLVLFSPHPFLVWKLPFITHSHCEFMAVVKLACADPAVTKAYNLMVASLIGDIDVLFIGLSYGLILHTVCQLPSKEAGLKALGTCGSHVCVILVFYSTAVFTFLTHRFSHGSIPPQVHIPVANVYLLIPPTLNPIIYGVRTKQIPERVLRGLRWKRDL